MARASIRNSRDRPVGYCEASHGTIGKVILREVLLRLVRSVLVGDTRVAPLASCDVISSSVLGVPSPRLSVVGAAVFISQELLRSLEGSSERAS